MKPGRYTLLSLLMPGIFLLCLAGAAAVFAAEPEPGQPTDMENVQPEMEAVQPDAEIVQPEPEIVQPEPEAAPPEPAPARPGRRSSRSLPKVNQPEPAAAPAQAVKAKAAAVPLPEAGEDEEVERYVTIDFDDVDITLFIKYISELTGTNFIIDKTVRGNVTIISPTKISVDEAYKVFESVLEVQGFTPVPAGSVVKIVPSVSARSKSVETGFRPETDEVTDKVVTQLIPLKYADADELKNLFAPLVSKNSVVISYPATNLLIVTDALSNISRLQQIIREIDVEEMGEEILVIPVEHASAAEIAKVLSTVFQNQQPSRTARRVIATRTSRAAPPAPASGNADAGSSGLTDAPVKILTDDRTNILIIVATADDGKKVGQLVKLLDREVPRGEGDIRVIYLEHAAAEELAKVLTSLPSKETAAEQKGQAPTISKDVQIVADKATNSLVITAKKADFIALEDVIKKLDIPRRMVYLEALIMEVNADKEFRIGTELLGGFTYNEGNGVVFGANRSGDSTIASLLNPVTASLPNGFTTGVFGDTITIGGISYPSIGAIVNAYKSDSDVHIVSNPQLLTTDNEEAEIKVGENVPYITSQNTTSSTQDYTNYEYKDVGVTMKITPQIGQEGAVRLNIFQEITKVKSAESVKSNTPVTLKRSAQTTVIVQDMNTVVIGGIIGDDVNEGVTKVPLLGDIPVLGWLFKNKSQTQTRTNLFIFLTPHIVRNPAEMRQISDRKKNESIWHHTEEKYGELFMKKEESAPAPGAPLPPPITPNL